MSDASREMIELRREIVEARNQAIKTDNQIKNLSLDVRGFEKRFDSLERRTRLAGVGVHAIVAVTIAVAAYMIHAVRTRQITSEITARTSEIEAQEKSANKSMQEARARLGEAEQEKSRREKSAVVALKLVEHLDAGREKDASELLGALDLRTLTTLEARLLDKRVGELRVRTADSAYRAGKNAISASRADVAIAELRRSLALDPDGRLANPARYYLATQLWAQKRFDELEPMLREIQKRDTDRAVLDETRYLLGLALAGLGRRDEARQVLTEVQQKGGRYASNAKQQLAQLEASGETADQPRPTTPAPATAPVKAATPAVSPTPTALGASPKPGP